MITHRLFLAFCDDIRSKFQVIGILVYSGHPQYKLMIAGCPYTYKDAVNNNEAKL